MNFYLRIVAGLTIVRWNSQWQVGVARVDDEADLGSESWCSEVAMADGAVLIGYSCRVGIVLLVDNFRCCSLQSGGMVWRLTPITIWLGPRRREPRSLRN